MTTDEKFFAWLDGELTDADAAEMEARVASDPELAALARQHRSMQARLGAAFDAIATAPVPDRLRNAIHAGTSNVVDLAERRERRRPAAWFAHVPQWATMAATLALGIFVGTFVTGSNDAPVELRGGSVYAAGEIGRALDTQLASEPSGGAVRVGLTFRDVSGDICRSFSGPAASGLACRREGAWRMRGLFPAGESQGSDYRMAAGMSPDLAALVDSTIAGEPMDAAQEKAAKDRGWR